MPLRGEVQVLEVVFLKQFVERRHNGYHHLRSSHCGPLTHFFSELSPQVLAAPGVASAGRHTKTKARVWAAVTPVSGEPVDGGGACVPCRRGSGTFPQSRRDIQ